MRNLFTDGLNSFWHFLFGFLSFYYKLIFPVFIIYELTNYKDPNLLIDFSEFFIGFMLSKALNII
jgi:hypothetical protein